MWMALSDSDRQLTEHVSFRDSRRIIIKVDDIAEKKGTDRSALYREAIRFWLAANSHLTDEEKKALGVNGEAKKEGA
jgi:metal-responsive CopG/Arc/MetJ family transcriptional regulator